MWKAFKVQILTMCNMEASIVFLRVRYTLEHPTPPVPAQTISVGDTRPDLSKVGNRVECNMSLTSQVCRYGASDWLKWGSSDQVGCITIFLMRCSIIIRH